GIRGAGSTGESCHAGLGIVDIPELDLGHYTPSQLLVGSSLGSTSNARSRERISQILRASTLTGAGILPSATIWSNLVAEIPMVTAAPAPERPRRGTGRTSEGGRAMWLTAPA